MKVINAIGLALWSVVLFAAGVFFATKIDKPDTVVNNDIKGVKIKGNANDADFINTPQTTVENVKKKRLRLFSKKRD